MSTAEFEFQAPPGFHPALFEDDVDDETSSLSHPHFEARASHSKQQLWLVKIPAGLDPADLDGVSIPVASTSSSKPVRFRAGFDGIEYEARLSAPAKKQDDAANDATEEMAGARVLLPHSDKGPGRMSFAPKDPARYLTVTLAPPEGAAASAPFAADGTSSGTLTSLAAATKTSGKGKAAATGASSATEQQTPAALPTAQAASELAAKQARRAAKREQPWERLNGSFAPSGSSRSSAQIDADWRQTLLTPSPPPPEVKTEPERVESSQAAASEAAAHAEESKDVHDPSTPGKKQKKKDKASPKKAPAPPTEDATSEAQSPAVAGKKRKSKGGDDGETPKKEKKAKKEKKDKH